MNTALPAQFRADDESDDAWSAYLTYRELGPGRTLAAAYRAHLARFETGSGPQRPEKARLHPPTVPGSWKRWRTRYDWDGRARDYDDGVELATQTARTQAIATQADEWVQRRAQAREAEWELSEKLRAKAVAMLAKLDPDSEDLPVTPFGVAKLIEVSSKLARLATGMETERVSGTTAPPVPDDLSELTDAELEELARAQRGK